MASETEAKSNVPIGHVDSEEWVSYIQTIKDKTKTMLLDLKDAKRRVSTAKGPKPKKKAATAEASGSDEEYHSNWGGDEAWAST